MGKEVGGFLKDCPQKARKALTSRIPIMIHEDHGSMEILYPHHRLVKI